MSTYRLIREQTIDRPLHEVFAFFADARNLETLTPPLLRFEILTPDDIDMQVGTLIQYALRVHGLPIHWTTAITVWNPPFEFVDVQLRGPYVMWHHRHTFEAVGRSTRMIDEVNYRLPLGWIGRAMHRLMVRRDLKAIFDYREQAVKRLLESEPSKTAKGLAIPRVFAGSRSPPRIRQAVGEGPRIHLLNANFLNFEKCELSPRSGSGLSGVNDLYDLRNGEFAVDSCS